MDGQLPAGTDTGEDGSAENVADPADRKRKARRKFWLQVRRSVIVLSAVGVLVVGFLWVRERQVVAGFTRVGGTTSVETAVDASEFWLNPPQFVVETPVGASQQVMLWAAQCAVVLDAPLLFSSPDSKRQSLVNATIRHWQETEPAAAVTVTVTSQAEVRACEAGHRASVSGLSTLKTSDPIVGLPPVAPPGNTLAPTVVFAAPLAPGDPPDVAIGFALAAHLAYAGNQVSLVVVPRYLEADLPLERQLSGRHGLINRSIVLGQTPTVPDDTRALLRQLVSTSSRLDQLVSLEGSAGLAVAILGLLGVFAAAAAAPAVVGAVLLAVQAFRDPDGIWSRMGRAVRSRWPGVVSRPRSALARAVRIAGAAVYWLGQTITSVGGNGAEMNDWVVSLQGQPVTLWLSSGSTVTGVVDVLQGAGVGSQGNSTADRSELTVLKVKSARLAMDPRGQEPPLDFVLVPVGRIDLIIPSRRVSTEVGQEQPAPRAS